MKKSLLLLILLIFTCFFIPTLSYLTWNSNILDLDVGNYKQLPDNSHYIDKCEINSRKINVQGWATKKGLSNPRNQAYLELDDGRFLKIYTKRQYRPEVSSYFNELYVHDHSGYAASASILLHKHLNKILVLTTFSGQENETYYTKHACE